MFRSPIFNIFLWNCMLTKTQRVMSNFSLCRGTLPPIGGRQHHADTRTLLLILEQPRRPKRTSPGRGHIPGPREVQSLHRHMGESLRPSRSLTATITWSLRRSTRKQPIPPRRRGSVRSPISRRRWSGGQSGTAITPPMGRSRSTSNGAQNWISPCGAQAEQPRIQHNKHGGCIPAAAKKCGSSES